MYNFNHHRPGSVDEAAAALSGADDGKLLAGGMTLIATLKQRLASPSDLVDIGGIAELQGISIDGGTVSIGFDAMPGEEVEGEVTSVVPQADAEIRASGSSATSDYAEPAISAGNSASPRASTAPPARRAPPSRKCRYWRQR